MRAGRLVLVVAMATAGLSPVMARASHGPCSLSDGGWSNPTVSSVGAGQSNWYGFSPTGTVTIRLQPLTGDADLYVYKIDNQSPCSSDYSSTAGSVTEDTVTVPAGSYNIEVRYYSSAIGFVEYILRAT